MRKPFIAKVQGQERQINPDMIQGKVICRVNMGIEGSIGMQEAQKIERMLAVLFQLNQSFPGLLTPEKIHNLSRRYITSLGFKQVDDFISDVRQYIQQAMQTQKQQSEMQQRMIALEQKLKEMEMMLKGEEVKIKKEEVEQKGEIEAAKIAQKERDSQRDYDIGLLQVLQSAGMGGENVPTFAQRNQ